MGHITDEELADELATVRRHLLAEEARTKAMRDSAATVIRLLELGDDRLLASDGPAGGRPPQLSPEEWGEVYRACKCIAGAAVRA